MNGNDDKEPPRQLQPPLADTIPDEYVLRQVLDEGSTVQLYDPSGHPLLERLGRTFRETVSTIGQLSCTAERRKDIRFEFLGTLKVDGLAKLDPADKNLNFLIINVGAVLVIQDLAMRFMADRRLFPTIGRPDGEAMRSEDFSQGLDGTHVAHQSHEKPGDWIIATPPSPRDAERMKFGHLVSLLVVEYMFRHELGHIISGHTVLASRLRANLNSAVGYPNKVKEPGLRQFMETDADLGAFEGVTRGLLGGPTFVLADEVTSLPKDLLLFAWAVAHAMYFRLFDQHGLSVSDYRLASHPHPEVRYRTASAVASEIVQEHSTSLATIWEEVKRQALQDIASAWSLFRIPGGFYNLLERDPSEALKEASRLLKNLPQLLEHNTIKRFDLRRDVHPKSPLFRKSATS